MRAAARQLWRELGVAPELSRAAMVAALVAGHYRPAAGERICALVCGAGTDGFEPVSAVVPAGTARISGRFESCGIHRLQHQGLDYGDTSEDQG